MGIIFSKLRSLIGRVRRFIVSQRFGFNPTAIYDATFYDGPGCQQGALAADKVADVVIGEFRPTSVFDLGCGNGAYLEEFARRGVPAYGCEGSEHGVRRCPPDVFVFKWDLKQPLVANRTFDLVTCIEVAEHLPPKSSVVLVQSISCLAERAILFCAAPPWSPPGDDHINCREPEFWDELFRECGWIVDQGRSARMREQFAKAGSPFWLNESTRVYERRPGAH